MMVFLVVLAMVVPTTGLFFLFWLAGLKKSTATLLTLAVVVGFSVKPFKDLRNEYKDGTLCESNPLGCRLVFLFKEQTLPTLPAPVPIFGRPVSVRERILRMVGETTPKLEYYWVWADTAEPYIRQIYTSSVDEWARDFDREVNKIDRELIVGHDLSQIIADEKARRQKIAFDAFVQEVKEGKQSCSSECLIDLESKGLISRDRVLNAVRREIYESGKEVDNLVRLVERYKLTRSELILTLGVPLWKVIQVEDAIGRYL